MSCAKRAVAGGNWCGTLQVSTGPDATVYFSVEMDPELRTLAQRIRRQEQALARKQSSPKSADRLRREADQREAQAKREPWPPPTADPTIEPPW